VSRQSSGPRLAQGGFLRPILLGLPLLDELLSGFLVISLPLVRRSLGLSYAQAGLLLTVGDSVAMLFDPVISLLSDRRSKRWPVLGGIIGMAVGFVLAARARSFGEMVVAYALISPANGIAVSLAQAALVDQAPEAAPRTVTRWTAMAAVGDLLAPLMLAAWTFQRLDWRPLYGMAAGAWLVLALLLWPQRFPAPAMAAGGEADGPAPGLLASLKPALRRPRLLRWMAVLVVGTLLDELFVGFGALFLTDVVRLTPAAASLALSAQMIGAILGLLALDRLLGRVNGERLLPSLSLLALAGTLLFVRARGIAWAGAALFLIGLGTSGWYPIAKAAAYAILPGRTGTVLAILGVTAPIEAALPALIGAIATRLGLPAAIGLLSLAPAGVLLLAPRQRPEPAADPAVRVELSPGGESD
jgi:predicted MFS family arabinose efflux permease